MNTLLRKESLIPTQAVHFFWHLSFFQCLIPLHLPCLYLQSLFSSWRNMVPNTLNEVTHLHFGVNLVLFAFSPLFSFGFFFQWDVITSWILDYKIQGGFCVNWRRMKCLLTKLYYEIEDCECLFNIFTHMFFMAVFIFSSINIYSLHAFHHAHFDTVNFKNQKTYLSFIKNLNCEIVHSKCTPTQWSVLPVHVKKIERILLISVLPSGLKRI